MISGAQFSPCRKYRFALWRVWDDTKPVVMFIGLNPSTADESKPDRTVESIIRICKHNNYGGFYIVNCFPYISTDPKLLNDFTNLEVNDYWISHIHSTCQAVVFAWGNFKVISDYGLDKKFKTLFADAYILGLNKNGSPKHPLFCKSTTTFISYENSCVCQ
jgi:hypothetical protein